MRYIIPLLSTPLFALTACGDSSTADAKIAYQCDSGAVIQTMYDNSDDPKVTVWYKSEKVELNISPSGSGAKYSNDSYVWWTKGSGKGAEATLFIRENDQIGGALETCVEKQ